jgi:hypothetical protein
MRTGTTRNSEPFVAAVLFEPPDAATERQRYPTSIRAAARAIRLCWPVLLCLLPTEFLPTRAASAAEPNAPEKSTVERTRQDEKAREKALRDAAGLVTIEGIVVDESGTPVPNARVRLISFLEPKPTALSDSQGRFHFFVDMPTTRFLGYFADNLRDGKKGFTSFAEEATLGLLPPVQVTLKPPRELIVAVNGPMGKPIADALVEVSESMLLPFDEGRTGPDGTVQFSLPADAHISSVFALKSGQGFDCWADRIEPKADRRTVPPKLSLTLNGARTVHVQAVDSSGSPVPGIDVVPWTIEKQGQGSYANLSGFKSQLVRTQTDTNGIATIDWLPVDLAKRVTFLARSRDFHLPQPPSFQPGQENVAELTMRLMRVTTISGKVLGPENKPAVGIILQAEGRGATNHYFRDLARTNANGEFEFRAYPHQAYLIAVLDRDWAAPSHTVTQLIEGKPVSGLEIQLVRGTVVRGVVTGPEGRVEANATVTLVQSATLRGAANAPDLISPLGQDRLRGSLRISHRPWDLSVVGPRS